MSEPIVPFRETIVETPKIDMVNEEIDDQNVVKQTNSDEKQTKKNTIVMYTSNKQCIIKIKAIPLPHEVTLVLEKNADILKLLNSQAFSTSKLNSQTQMKLVPLDDDFIKLDITSDVDVKDNKSDTEAKLEITNLGLKAIENFKSELDAAFKSAGTEWNNATEEIWSAGPRKCGPNLLLNRIKDFKKSLFDYDLEIIDCVKDSRNDYTSSFVNGFQLATLAGPLCDEPMMGVAFVIKAWTILKAEQDEIGITSQPYGPFSGVQLLYSINLIQFFYLINIIFSVLSRAVFQSVIFNFRSNNVQCERGL